MREIIQLCVGQAGVNIGQAIWKQICLENGISFDSTPDKINDNVFFETLIQERRNDLKPRTVFVDLDPDSIFALRKSDSNHFFDQEYMVYGKEDSANNFIKAHYTMGHEIANEALDKIRRQAEQCDSLQGILMHHSLIGGTGSGIGTLLLSRICVDYHKLNVINNEIYSSDKSDNSTVVECFNTTLSTGDIKEFSNLTIMNTNAGLSTICQMHQRIERPSLKEYNSIIARSMSQFLQNFLYSKQIPITFGDIIHSLVPFPMMHYVIPAYTPFGNNTMDLSDTCRLTQTLTTDIFQTPSYLAYINPPKKAFPNICSALFYSGPVNQLEISQATSLVKSKWNFRVSESNNKAIYTSTQPSPLVKQPDAPKISLFALHHNLALTQLYEKTNANFDRMFAKRAFVHWYMGEGLAEGEFQNQREEAAALLKDYEWGLDAEDEDEIFTQE